MIIVLKNDITEKEKDIISTHMFPVCPTRVPKYAESWLVDIVDDVVYETDKNGVLTYKGGKNGGITGVAITKFAKGSSKISRDQIGWTNEQGQELLYRNKSGAILTPLSSGDKVFTNEMANRSYGCIFLMIIVAIMAYFLA